MDEMPGMSFGHAGTIVEGKEDTATEKIARLAEAGIVVAEEISEIPGIVKEKMGASLSDAGGRAVGEHAGLEAPRR
jgi:succinyl-CoA synthetase alpha subunit